MSALFSKAYGQTSALPQVVIDTLNLALLLEYLEKYFYQTALASNIFNDENLHITTIRGVLMGSAIADPTRSGFDYTGSQSGRRPALFPTLGGASSTTGNFTSVTDFLAVGQQFVDTGVRVYKGGTEAFDKPLDAATVKAIAKNFAANPAALFN